MLNKITTESDYTERPLSGFPLFRAHNLDDAHRLIAKHTRPHRIQIADKEDLLDVHFDGIDRGSVTIIHTYYGSAVNIHPDSDCNSYYLQTTLSGKGEIVLGNQKSQTGTGDTVIASPAIPYHMQLKENCSRLAVQIDRSCLEKYLSSILYDEVKEDLVFELQLCSGADTWQSTLEYIFTQACLSPFMFQQATVKQAFSDVILSSILELQPHNYSQKLHRDGEKILPKQLTIAFDYIHENIKSPITIAELAKQTNVSVRTLQRNFIRYTQKTPVEYIRDQKLNAIHQILSTCDTRLIKGGITRILLDYGISDLSRFAFYYRQKYGCTPSETPKK